MVRKQRIPFGTIQKVGASNENQVQNAICDYLALKKYFFWRQNTMGVFDPKKNVYRKPPKYFMAGVSDIILLHDGISYFLEVKDKSKQSENQKKFEKKVLKSGCEYHVVRSIDDLIKIGL